MLLHPELVTTAKEIAALSEKLKNKSKIAFDTEFIREKTFYPQLEIIQVATDEESWLIDAQAFPRRRNGEALPDIEPLIEVFQDPSILKIVHAAQADQECLYTNYKIVATPILDTAVAASLCGLGESIGLAPLLRSVLRISIQKGYARTNWAARPLPPHLIEYAHADVEHLVELGRKLVKKLETMGRLQWALDVSNQWSDPKMYQTDPESIARRLSKSGRITQQNYPILVELIRWRETKVREYNIPRRWLADDDVLMSIAEMRPKDVHHLKSLRGLNSRALKDDGKEILAAIERGERTSDVKMPKVDRPKPPNSEEARAIDLLKCYIELLANRNNISPKQLIDSRAYLSLVRSKTKEPETWVQKSIITPFAANLIGQDIAALLKGERLVTIQNGKIEILHSNHQAQS